LAIFPSLSLINSYLLTLLLPSFNDILAEATDHKLYKYIVQNPPTKMSEITKGQDDGATSSKKGPGAKKLTKEERKKRMMGL
jgi:hypothetical protein